MTLHFEISVQLSPEATLREPEAEIVSQLKWFTVSLFRNAATVQPSVTVVLQDPEQLACAWIEQAKRAIIEARKEAA